MSSLAIRAFDFTLRRLLQSCSRYHTQYNSFTIPKLSPAIVSTLISSAIVFSLSSFSCTYPVRIAHCSEDSKVISSSGEGVLKSASVGKMVISDEDIEGTEYWDEKKAQCSFCKAFLESPCATAFKWWSTCVDRAKDKDMDYADACSEYTSALFQCTGQHKEYFEQLQSHIDRSDDADEEE